MTSHHPRPILTPGASRKRRQREEGLYSGRESAPPETPPAVSPETSSKAAESVSSNRLLAGYMAYEFLTKGTLFGQEWDPVRAQPVPLSSTSAELKKSKPRRSSEAEPNGKHQMYAEVASFFMNGGAHIPGIVNPTQLAQWIRM